jgi:hypothetical protein
MRPSPSLAKWVLATCSVLLLVSQVLGLHFHRHVERDGVAVAHAAELHFENGGLHAGDTHADHRHEQEAAGGSSHWHVDVESRSQTAGLAKAFVDSLLLPLLLLATVLGCTRAVGVPLRPLRLLAPSQPRPYSLRPPSQGPPARSVLA